MTYQQVLENARTCIGPYCKACNDCNGKVCRNTMPGPGAKGEGTGFIRNAEKWREICVNMDTICENSQVDTSFTLFDRTFEIPAFAAPVGAMRLHYGDKYDDLTYNDILVRACANAGILAFTGDGTDPKVVEGAAEALKAQAVAAHTYAERQHLLEQEQPTPELCGADFSNDSSQYQACFTENQARQYYGDSFQTSYAKICDAVDEVLPYVLESGGSPIVAAFCSMSAGKTESAENVWGASVPYLVSVDSSADTTAPRYLETADFTAQELQTQLAGLLPDADWDTAPADWFHIVSTTDAGTVQTLTVCGQTCTGQEVRDALALRSAAFTVACADGKFTFTTRGFGHGVGMSQYGANAMAKDGADWREILMHYYPETEIVSFSE